jgi:hypothetical protein
VEESWSGATADDDDAADPVPGVAQQSSALFSDLLGDGSDARKHRMLGAGYLIRI